MEREIIEKELNLERENLTIVQADLSNYYTKEEINEMLSQISGGMKFISIDMADEYDERNAKLQQFYNEYLEDNNKFFILVTGLYHYYCDRALAMITHWEVENGNGTFIIAVDIIPYYEGIGTTYGISAKIIKHIEMTVNVQNNQIIYSSLSEDNSALAFDNDLDILGTSNIEEYYPDGDFNPATKNYVDSIVGDINTILDTLTNVEGGVE